MFPIQESVDVRKIPGTILLDVPMRHAFLQRKKFNMGLFADLGLLRRGWVSPIPRLFLTIKIVKFVKLQPSVTML